MLWRHRSCEVTSPSSQNPLIKLVLPKTVSDINIAIIGSGNGNFLLLESLGFEHEEGENFKKVVNFLKDRKDMPNVRDRVHAVWYVYCSSITCVNKGDQGVVQALFPSTHV